MTFLCFHWIWGFITYNHELSNTFLFLKVSFLKFMFSKKATKFDKIFTIDLTLSSKCQIISEDFINFCGLLRKHELYDVLSFSSKHQEEGKTEKSLIIHVISALEAIFDFLSKVLCHHFLSSKYQMFFFDIGM